MPPITAILHTKNHEFCLGRALETLFPIAEILVADHDSTDSTQRIAREYGARVVKAESPFPNHYIALGAHEWFFCLDPQESITEGLQASLFEWRALPQASASRPFDPKPSYSVQVREHRGAETQILSGLETRLIHRSYTKWDNRLPVSDPRAILLEGELLRFVDSQVL